MKYLAESVEPVSPKEIEKIDAESPELIDLPKFNVPKISTQNKILSLSLKNPISTSQYKEAMEKHLAEQKVPVRIQKYFSGVLYQPNFYIVLKRYEFFKYRKSFK